MLFRSGSGKGKAFVQQGFVLMVIKRDHNECVEIKTGSRQRFALFSASREEENEGNRQEKKDKFKKGYICLHKRPLPISLPAIKNHCVLKEFVLNYLKYWKLLMAKSIVIVNDIF